MRSVFGARRREDRAQGLGSSRCRAAALLGRAPGCRQDTHPGEDASGGEPGGRERGRETWSPRLRSGAGWQDKHSLPGDRLASASSPAALALWITASGLVGVVFQSVSVAETPLRAAFSNSSLFCYHSWKQIKLIAVTEIPNRQRPVQREPELNPLLSFVSRLVPSG